LVISLAFPVGGGRYLTCSNYFYLPLLLLEKRGGGVENTLRRDKSKQLGKEMWRMGSAGERVQYVWKWGSV
jgi:hypothetical protein